MAWSSQTWCKQCMDLLSCWDSRLPTRLHLEDCLGHQHSKYQDEALKASEDIGSRRFDSRSSMYEQLCHQLTSLHLLASSHTNMCGIDLLDRRHFLECRDHSFRQDLCQNSSSVPHPCFEQNRSPTIPSQARPCYRSSVHSQSRDQYLEQPEAPHQHDQRADNSWSKCKEHRSVYWTWIAHLCCRQKWHLRNRPESNPWVKNSAWWSQPSVHAWYQGWDRCSYLLLISRFFRFPIQELTLWGVARRGHGEGQRSCQYGKR